MSTFHGSVAEQEILSLMQGAMRRNLKIESIFGPPLSLGGRLLKELFGRPYFVCRTNHTGIITFVV